MAHFPASHTQSSAAGFGRDGGGGGLRATWSTYLELGGGA